ncbi:phosphotransferase [Streptomyces mobaraensis NBRC 13819 = DSM 40847]|uniref:Aminoglycoside phosphotransferase domain-containing protein n=1 Tax=Streptomyces mobaraensis (strain ATCC 29032 / DSM 40847 / JCM 4168 / NBRC 13819 / NCIMB 11159 / IPCR 16-22) TaxID=1223523 RepID=M3C1Y6_STRM1|nr:phosphotransferase [Streptomyces mobaraensis]EME97971.1 hypothetical protein H340_23813 [Streptomyces mobaraensis NBRC 13819 = DSM 40847]QTT76747.1 phosphotransferase [Streptomyces mobaraensis NBRC 13819 = DSM 40847]
MTGRGEDVDEGLLAIAEAALPGQRWHGARVLRHPSHDVLLLPGTAAVRVARTPSAAAVLPRQAELLRRLARLDLPFKIPGPLSEVVTVQGRTGVALSWVYGWPTPRPYGHERGRLLSFRPERFSELLGVLSEVDCGPLQDVLGVPHEGVGGHGWGELMLGEVIPRLPWTRRREARRRIGQAQGLPVPEPRLVHGKLDADNLLWDGRRRLVGVLGWDRAQLFDPALDTAWLFGQQWDPRRAGADREQMRRIRIWVRTLGLEPLARAILDHESEEHLAYEVGKTVAWLDQTTGW